MDWIAENVIAVINLPSYYLRVTDYILRVCKTSFLLAALQCFGGGVYSECHSDCESSCHYLEDHKSFCLDSCVAGCQCHSGTYLNDNGECVPLQYCPCYHQRDDIEHVVLPGEAVAIGCANWY